MKPHVYGLKDKSTGWFYVAACDRCDWSYGWDGDMAWETLVAMAECHWWLYVDTDTCLRGG